MIYVLQNVKSVVMACLFSVAHFLTKKFKQAKLMLTISVRQTALYIRYLNSLLKKCIPRSKEHDMSVTDTDTV